MVCSRQQQAEEVDEHKVQLTPPGFHVIFLPFADDFRKVNYDEECPRGEQYMHLWRIFIYMDFSFFFFLLIDGVLLVFFFKALHYNKFLIYLFLWEE